MLSQKKEKVKELKDMNTEAEKLVSHFVKTGGGWLWALLIGVYRLYMGVEIW